MSASASAATGDKAGPPAVAWVESPLQLINAIEFAASQEIALVIEPRANVLQLDATIDAVRAALPAGVEITAPLADAGDGLFRSAAHKVVGDVFSGQFRLLVARRGVRSLTIVDDGSATVHLAAALNGGSFSRMAQIESAAMRALGAVAKNRILAAARRGRVSLFTAYGAEPAVAGLAVRGLQVDENSYHWLHSLSSAGVSPVKSRVILGSALVTDRQIAEDDYLAWVAAVVGTDVVRGEVMHSPVSYLPHRRESGALRSAVAAIPGVTVEPGSLPAELALGASPHLELVETLPSSAVVTLSAILDGNVTIAVTRIPDSWWLPGADPAIRRAFDQLAGAHSSYDRKDDHVD